MRVNLFSYLHKILRYKRFNQKNKEKNHIHNTHNGYSYMVELLDLIN